MIRSLRLRLVLISTLVSGVAIVGVSLLAWYFMERAVRESVDVRLEAISGRILRDLHPRADLEFLGRRIQLTHEDEILEKLLLLHVRDDVNDVVVFSSLDDGEKLREQFPPGFPQKPEIPGPRPNWDAPIPPGTGPMKGGKQSKGGLPRFEDDFPPREMPLPPGRRPDEPDLTEEEWREIEREFFALRPQQRKGEKKAEVFETRGRMESQYATIDFEGQEWRIVVSQGRGYSTLAGLDLTRSKAELNRFKNGFLFGIPLAILLIGFGGWLVADRALRPIRRIAVMASDVTAQSLSQRIEEVEHSDAEIEHLITVLNAMMDRLETGFSHANRFSADVSHELKTPITVMQAEIETALQESVADSPEETRLLVLREEVGRLKSITQSLMLLSQADVGELIRKSDPISLSEELQSLVEDAEIVAEGAGISVAASLSPDVEVRGDPVLLRQALLNLINNAIKYNVPEGDVSVILAAQSDHAMISIENSSEGISPADQEKIFDRFYRADQSRSRGVDGFGLGLSLAQAVVKGHGGTIDLIVEEEKRTRFEVRFPLSREGS